MFLILWLEIFGVYGLGGWISSSYDTAIRDAASHYTVSFASVIADRTSAPAAALSTTFVASAFAGVTPSINVFTRFGLSLLHTISAYRWCTEAFVDQETQYYRALFRVDTQIAGYFGLTLNRFWLDLLVALVLGIVYRILGFSLLLFCEYIMWPLTYS